MLPEITQYQQWLRRRSPHASTHIHYGNDLTLFFQLGMMPDGDFAGGGMAKVIENGTSKLPERDLEAIVTFLESLPPH